jgi:hypothetical protein
MTIRIVEDFTGYPDGKTPRDFRVGERPSDLPAEFVELITSKGHAVKETAGRSKEIKS